MVGKSGAHLWFLVAGMGPVGFRIRGWDRCCSQPGFRETSGHRGCAGLSRAGSVYGLRRGFSGTHESQIIAALPRASSFILVGLDAVGANHRSLLPINFFCAWLVAPQLFETAVVTLGHRCWPSTPGWSGLDPDVCKRDDDLGWCNWRDGEEEVTGEKDGAGSAWTTPLKSGAVASIRSFWAKTPH